MGYGPEETIATAKNVFTATAELRGGILFGTFGPSISALDAARRCRLGRRRGRAALIASIVGGKIATARVIVAGAIKQRNRAAEALQHHLGRCHLRVCDCPSTRPAEPGGRVDRLGRRTQMRSASITLCDRFGNDAIVAAPVPSLSQRGFFTSRGGNFSRGRRPEKALPCCG